VRTRRFWREYVSTGVDSVVLLWNLFKMSHTLCLSCQISTETRSVLELEMTKSMAGSYSEIDQTTASFALTKGKNPQTPEADRRFVSKGELWLLCGGFLACTMFLGLLSDPNPPLQHTPKGSSCRQGILAFAAIRALTTTERPSADVTIT
jgi:hypothetical protein